MGVLQEPCRAVFLVTVGLLSLTVVGGCPEVAAPPEDNSPPAGGLRADVHRLTILQAKVRAAAERIWSLCEPLGQIPSFETVVRDHYVPDDQAAW